MIEEGKTADLAHVSAVERIRTDREIEMNSKKNRNMLAP